MVLIEVKYKKDLEIVDKYKQSHTEYLTSFYDKGLILASGPYNNRAGDLLFQLWMLNVLITMYLMAPSI